MRIAILGAPGSGKTELAEALKPKLEGKTQIIDNYVEQIGAECDLAMGGEATYIGNLYVALGRYARERKARGCGCYANIITCGTLIESSVYATLNAMTGMSKPDEQSANWTRITNFMNILGSIYQDTVLAEGEGYDQAYVLSHVIKNQDPVAEQVDKSLFMALNTFNFAYTPLEGSLDQKLEAILADLEDEHETETD